MRARRSSVIVMLGVLGVLGVLAAVGACAAPAPRLGPVTAATGTATATPNARPCFTVQTDPELRAKDAAKMLEELVKRIRLSPEDEALRVPRSIADADAILRRDVVYLFAGGAAFARSLDTTEGRIHEATFELLLGESQLIASQILSTQEAWIGADLRIARANLASGGSALATDRGRMLDQLIRVVEEGNKIGDALGLVAPSHITRGADVIRRLRAEAPSAPRTFALIAEYHRLRGEWAEFDRAMSAAEGKGKEESNGDATEPSSRRLCYLRGMEQLERFRSPELGAKKLRECLAAFPKFVRAQAGLVLMTTNTADGLRELGELKRMNEDHYMVMLLEPTLSADQELVRMQGGETNRAR